MKPLLPVSRRAALAGAAAALATPALAQARIRTSVGVLRLSSSGPVFIAQERG